MSYGDKIAALKPGADADGRGGCLCWDHLRAAGITPTRDAAKFHRDFPYGRIRRTDNGGLDKDLMESEKKEKQQSQRNHGVKAAMKEDNLK